MAESALQPATDLSDADADGGGTPWWKSASTLRWLAVIVVASLVIQGAIYLLVSKSPAGRTIVPIEYTVGTFSFASDSSAEAHAGPAKFDLHVRFIDDLNVAARRRLIDHQFRVRESVEALLRKSHGLELTDTGLARLKHEIQERIDEALDLRAVAEVIITDLAVPPSRLDEPQRSTENAAVAPPNDTATIRKPSTQAGADRQTVGTGETTTTSVSEQAVVAPPASSGY
jgi:flagellar basal body-associated protein FliL